MIKCVPEPTPSNPNPTVDLSFTCNGNSEWCYSWTFENATPAQLPTTTPPMSDKGLTTTPTISFKNPEAVGKENLVTVKGFDGNKNACGEAKIMVIIPKVKIKEFNPCEGNNAIKLDLLPESLSGNLVIKVKTDKKQEFEIFNQNQTGGIGLAPTLNWNTLPAKFGSLPLRELNATWTVGGASCKSQPFPIIATSVGTIRVSSYFTPVNASYVGKGNTLHVGNSTIQVHQDWLDACVRIRKNKVAAVEAAGVLQATDSTIYHFDAKDQETKTVDGQKQIIKYVATTDNREGACQAGGLTENRAVAAPIKSKFFQCGDPLMILGLNGSLNTNCHKVEDVGGLFGETAQIDKWRGRGGIALDLGDFGDFRVLLEK